MGAPFAPHPVCVCNPTSQTECQSGSQQEADSTFKQEIEKRLVKGVFSEAWVGTGESKSSPEAVSEPGAEGKGP